MSFSFSSPSLSFPSLSHRPSPFPSLPYPSFHIPSFLSYQFSVFPTFPSNLFIHFFSFPFPCVSSLPFPFSVCVCVCVLFIVIYTVLLFLSLFVPFLYFLFCLSNISSHLLPFLLNSSEFLLPSRILSLPVCVSSSFTSHLSFVRHSCRLQLSPFPSHLFFGLTPFRIRPPPLTLFITSLAFFLFLLSYLHR